MSPNDQKINQDWGQSESNLTPSDLAKRSMPKFGKVLIIIILTTAAVILLSFGIVSLLKYLNEQTHKTSDSTDTTKRYSRIDLQPSLDRWLNAQVNKKNNSILIYDLDNQEIIARNYDFSQVNSLGVENLFLVYLAYMRIEQGLWQKTDQLHVGNATINRENCLTKIIQENHTGCVDSLISEIGLDSLKQFLKDQSYNNTNFTNHLSNTSDLLSLAKRLNSHPDFSETLWQELKTKLIPNPSISISDPLLSGFSSLKTYGLSGSQTSNLDHSLNYSYYNSLYLLEVNNEDSAKKRSFILICLITDTSSAALNDLAKGIEKPLIEDIKE